MTPAVSLLKRFARAVADDQVWLAGGAVCGSIAGIIVGSVLRFEASQSIGAIIGALVGVILRELRNHTHERTER